MASVGGRLDGESRPGAAVGLDPALVDHGWPFADTLETNGAETRMVVLMMIIFLRCKQRRTRRGGRVPGFWLLVVCGITQRGRGCRRWPNGPRSGSR